MRKVTYGAGVSLDNYLAGVHDEVDWLRWTEDVAALTSAFWAGIDTVVMGRRTWEVAARGGTPAYPGVRNYVFSRTLSPHAGGGAVEIVRDDAAEFVGALKVEHGAGICVMGGGQLAAALFDAGLIDEVGVNIHPLLLGAGLPFCPALVRRVDLELIEARPLKEDCFYLLYRVRH